MLIGVNIMVTIFLVKLVIVVIPITLVKVHMVDITVTWSMMITTTIGTDMCADSKATWREGKIDILI